MVKQQNKKLLKIILCSATIDEKMVDELKRSGVAVDTFVVETKRNGVVREHIEEDMHIYELTN